MQYNKLVVILGPTASGKSKLAVQLAKKLKGEIVSADSRQVYRGMDIGTAKPTKRERQGIPHHLLDVASPKKRFTVAQYQRFARRIIENIQKRKKLPFLVGGSPLYIYAVVDGIIFPQVKPNGRLRFDLNQLSAEELFRKLKKLDPRRAKTIEQKNKRRIIRALEIVLSTKKPVPLLKMQPLPYPVLFLGITKSSKQLKRNIKKRFLKMLKQGFLKEVQQLKASGLSFKRIEEFGLEYREASQYIQKRISKKEMIEKAVKATQDFARRQMAWFKKDPRIHWIKDTHEVKSLVREFVLNLV